MIKLIVDSGIEDELNKLSGLNDFVTVEDYIASILKKEIIVNKLRVMFPNLLESLAVIEAGTIFKITDLIEINLECLLFTEIAHEIDYMFETYLAKSNQIDAYSVLFFDEKTFVNTYLKM